MSQTRTSTNDNLDAPVEDGPEPAAFDEAVFGANFDAALLAIFSAGTVSHQRGGECKSCHKKYLDLKAVARARAVNGDGPTPENIRECVHELMQQPDYSEERQEADMKRVLSELLGIPIGSGEQDEEDETTDGTEPTVIARTRDGGFVAIVMDGEHQYVVMTTQLTEEGRSVCVFKGVMTEGEDNAEGLAVSERVADKAKAAIIAEEARDMTRSLMSSVQGRSRDGLGALMLIELLRRRS